MKRWHLYVLAVVVVAALWWRWRSKTIDVNATVTIPQDEIKVTSSASIFQLQPTKSDVQSLIDISDAAIAADDAQNGGGS